LSGEFVAVRIDQESLMRDSLVHLTGSYLLGVASAFALAMNVVFFETFHPARLSVVLVMLVLIHLMLHPKVAVGRETAIYVSFFVYMIIALLWTDDQRLAMNTLVPALNFIIILILFDSLLTYYHQKAVLFGMLSGSVGGALIHTVSAGFPFTFPPGFSYNAVAITYTFGLFTTLMLGNFINSKVLLRLMALVFFAHIVATTSIKTNVGLIFGIAVGGMFYFRTFCRIVRRNIVALVLLLAAFGYVAATNDLLTRSVERGVNRIALGLEVLQAREDLPGYRGFNARSDWQKLGLEGWAQNPMFGNGVESFRARVGTTAHSSPVDLLHNSGVIGLVFYYALFASLAFRLLLRARADQSNVRFLIMSGLACFFFISLSAPMHYSSFFAAFLGISVALLRETNRQASEASAATSTAMS